MLQLRRPAIVVNASSVFPADVLAEISGREQLATEATFLAHCAESRDDLIGSHMLAALASHYREAANQIRNDYLEGYI